MVKNAIGGLYGVTAAILFLILISNNTFSFGAFFLLFIPCVLVAFSSIFLITFDGSNKKTFIKGFKKRKKQCFAIPLLCVINVALKFLFVYCIGASFSFIYIFIYILSLFAEFSSPENHLNNTYSLTSLDQIRFQFGLLLILMLIINLAFYVCMYVYYVVPYRKCNKFFKLSNALLNEYLSEEDSFHSYTPDKTVLANDKILFLPETFCVIPLEQISSTSYVDLFVKRYALFNLINGKKIKMIASKKKYDGIVAAIEDNK